MTLWHKEWIFGIAMCKIYMTTTSINQITSSIFLTVMSADRYVAVCHPISSPKFRTNVIARVVSLTAWATSALLMVPVFMYAATIKQLDGTSETCNIYWPWSHDADNETAINDTAINDTEAVEGKLRIGDFSMYVKTRESRRPPRRNHQSHECFHPRTRTIHSFGPDQSAFVHPLLTEGAKALFPNCFYKNVSLSTLYLVVDMISKIQRRFNGTVIGAQ